MYQFDLSIIIISFNTKEITYNCINSIFNSITNYSYEIILIDNNSNDDSVSNISQSFKNIKIFALSENIGFSKANNIGINYAKGEFIFLLNSDTILFTDTINDLLNEIKLKNDEIYSPVILNSDCTIQRSIFNFPSPLKVFLRISDFYSIIFKFIKYFKKSTTYNKKINYVSFAAVIMKSEIFKRIGTLDENLFFYHEDCEFGLRAHLHNIKIIKLNKTKLIHLGGSSSNEFSISAFENDIIGLVYIFRKYYSYRTFILLKLSIISALLIRILLWHIGLYRRIKKISIYEDKIPKNKINDKHLLNKYISLLKQVFNSKYN
jgi:GT2 family glycosyltransferase